MLNDKQIKVLAKKAMINKKFLAKSAADLKNDVWTDVEAKAWSQFANSIDGMYIYAKKRPSTEFPAEIIKKIDALSKTEKVEKPETNEKPKAEVIQEEVKAEVPAAEEPKKDSTIKKLAEKVKDITKGKKKEEK